MALPTPNARTVTIANAGQTSGALDVREATILGLITPAALTGTALTFNVSMDSGTFVPLYDSTGTLVSLTVGTSRGFALDPSTFLPWRYVQVVSGTAEGAARTITLIVRPVA